MTTKVVTTTLMELIQIAAPYDIIYSRDEVVKVIRENPTLEEDFQENCSEEFIHAVEEKGVCFILNNESWKNKTIQKEKPILRLSRCGYCKMPTISITI